MKKPLSFALTALSLTLLQACGGGGGSDAGNAPAAGGTGTATTTNTGSVTAAFNRGALARYQLTSVGSQSFGVLSTSVQDPAGALTTINANVLSGSTSVKEIAGDATYAMGRWAVASGGSSTGGSTTTPVVVSPGMLTAAGRILNDGGKVYAGDIVLQTPNINNDGGTIDVANLAVSGPFFSNAGGTLNVKSTFAANVGALNNAGGRLHAGTIGIATTSDLNNQGGTLAGDGAVNLYVAGSLNNTQGSIQSAGSTASLNVANQLLNDKGSIGAGTDLSVQAGSIANTGTLRAERDSTISVTNALSNDGRMISGRHTTVNAGSLAGNFNGVLGAGIKADGTLGTAGDLTVTTTGSLQAAGAVLAASNIAAQGASTDLSGTQRVPSRRPAPRPPILRPPAHWTAPQAASPATART